MGRELKRVPEGFRWPIGQVWFGYVIDAIPCSICDGDGKALPSGNEALVTCFMCDGKGYYGKNQAPCQICNTSGFCGSEHCHVCDGDGMVSPKIEVPTGPWYQVWETVSEGSPCSPPFATKEELARWMAEHSDGVTDDAGYEQWLQFIEDGYAPSLIVSRTTAGVRVMSGVAASTLDRR